MPSEIIRAKAMYCYFQLPRKQRIVLTDQLPVKNAWVDCRNITIGTPHEYFDRTAWWYAKFLLSRSGSKGLVPTVA